MRISQRSLKGGKPLSTRLYIRSELAKVFSAKNVKPRNAPKNSTVTVIHSVREESGHVSKSVKDFYDRTWNHRHFVLFLFVLFSVKKKKCVSSLQTSRETVSFRDGIATRTPAFSFMSVNDIKRKRRGGQTRNT